MVVFDVSNDLCVLDDKFIMSVIVSILHEKMMLVYLC